jgi:hypothetical protein
MTAKPGYALAEEILHALGDVGLLEELAAIAFRRDQLVKLLDLVAELDAERIGLQLAGISNGLHGRISRIVPTVVRQERQSIWLSREREMRL